MSTTFTRTLHPIATEPVPRSGIARVRALAPPPTTSRSAPGVVTAATQGTLALALDPTPGLARPQPDLTMIAGGRAELDVFAARLVQTVVEVMDGDRSVHQLLQWTTQRVYDDLARRAARLQRVTPPDRGARRLRAQVRSVHLFCPTPAGVEVSVHLRHGQRSHALAARLDLMDGRWRCTALQFC